MARHAAIQSAETMAFLRAVVAGEKDLAVRSEDRLAKHFLGRKYRLLVTVGVQALLKRILEFAVPGSYGFTIARTRHFDELLLSESRAGIEQLVLLGAGYDTRPFRLRDALRNIRVFEIDHPGTQARKRRMLAQIDESSPANVSYIPVDFNKQSLQEALAEHGFSPRQEDAVPVGGRLLLPAAGGCRRCARLRRQLRCGELHCLRLCHHRFRQRRHVYLRRTASGPLAQKDPRTFPVRAGSGGNTGIPESPRARHRLRPWSGRPRENISESQGWSLDRHDVRPRPHGACQSHRREETGSVPCVPAECGPRYETAAQKNSVRELNDALRQTFTGGRVLVSPGVLSLPAEANAEVLERVRSFTAFDAENAADHDFGRFDLAGVAYCFELECPPRAHDGSKEAPDGGKATRVLTIMCADEY